ncbi:N-terminal half of MaoC dehydratase [Salinihabitans flavidus]|uniref:N-terminal half of MaoC dehydratase n=1 Tax=Salinihabitans flavidus TaxID=569882 RepID=A0A1H8MCN1_9RHOB|nr:MaoC family dehydratase N-terminal domain-containing protein [Salinihabitans flavidus]SEO15054.1 N-terminal half of MaoC dehydratase [Salinihabitans flavidus]
MGIFDRTTTGHVTAPLSVAVERGALRFFAETIGETDPVHFDSAAARAAGYPDLRAPPTYAVVLDTAAATEATRRGLPRLLDLIGADLRYLLHGTERYCYHGTIHAGDTLEITHEVTGFSDAKGGALEIAHLKMRITHPARGPLVIATRDLIHRLPKVRP